MRILVLGAAGMAGHMITLYLLEKGYDVVGLARRPLSFSPYIVQDVLDTQALKNVVSQGEYDVIINCIGVLNQFVDRNIAKGIYINSYLPHFLVDCVKDTKTKIIHLSTDCVFSGDKGSYLEKQDTDSKSLYGKSKALGEINENGHLTIRTSIVGPDINKEGIGLLNWFLTSTNTVKGYDKVIWTGVTTLTLAKAIEALMFQEVDGLIHLVNNTSISKYDLLHLFNSLRYKGMIEIKNDSSIYCNKSLVSTRTDYEFQVPSYEQMVDELKEWMDKHRNLYPQYK